MCGGVSFDISLFPEEDILSFFPSEEFIRFKRTGMVETFFWSKRPILPADISGVLRLYDWGNRDKGVDLPRTGWAKIESLNRGKWDYLNPQSVKIPVKKGFEKNVWFNVAKGIRGIRVQKDDSRRVYMITQPASERYVELTGHHRMPFWL